MELLIYININGAINNKAPDLEGLFYKRKSSTTSILQSD